MLRAHKIFGCLTAEQCEALVQASPVVSFATHEQLLVQGAAGDSMFVLVRGAVDVRIAKNGEMKSVAKLGAGDCVGEMSLLTGDPRTATVVVRGRSRGGGDRQGGVRRVRAIRTLAVIDQLGELLAQRQLANSKFCGGERGGEPRAVAQRYPRPSALVLRALNERRGLAVRRSGFLACWCRGDALLRRLFAAAASLACCNDRRAVQDTAPTSEIASLAEHWIEGRARAFCLAAGQNLVLRTQKHGSLALRSLRCLLSFPPVLSRLIAVSSAQKSRAGMRRGLGKTGACGALTSS
jgi:hypothetical protein